MLDDAKPLEGDQRVATQWDNTPLPGMTLPFWSRVGIAINLIRMAGSVIANRRWTAGRIERG